MEDKEKKIDAISEPEITEADFTFVQANEGIHEKKFQTKPTTFFKDAMKRFVKSRSSVVAAGILTVLIGMAIIVPIADTNSIETPLADARYLPPKWFDNAGGFLDGTRMIDRAVLDPQTEDFPEDSSYRQDAVVGEVKKWSDYADTLTPAVGKYGRGGAISIKNSGDLEQGIFTANDVALASSSLDLDLTDDNIFFSFQIDKENMKLGVNTKLNYYLGFIYDVLDDTVLDISGNPTVVTKISPLTEVYSYSEESEEEVLVSNIAAKLQENDDFAGELTAEGSIGIVVAAPEDLASSANVLLVKSVTTSIPKLSFSDATKTAAKVGNADSPYQSFNFAGINIYHSEILYGSFRYDPYQHAFGDVPGYVFSSKDIQSYIDNGWMTYEWSEETGDHKEPGAFSLTAEGEIYCPLREVQYQNYVKNPLKPELSRKELVGTRSLYRVLYAEGKITKCEMPRYVFGTNKNGYDFFKMVFSGLLISLGLGFLASIINIFIGLIWGSVAGYFGGATDFIMERVTEILGGVPFIIVMTLITLFANNGGGGTTFGTFLFALCMTGWLGVAGITRAQFYRYKGREYVLASRTLGASNTRLIFKHILPNSLGTIVTSAVLMIPGVIFTEANISYLLPGALALDNTFGVTLQSVQSDLAQYPYLIVSASIIMALIMISFNLFGNGLRDAFNPSLKGTED